MACFLLIEGAKVACENFLMEHLSMETCVAYVRVAWRYDLDPLLYKSTRLLQARFHDFFIHDPDVLTLPAGCLKTFILKVSAEFLIFYFCCL